MSVRYNDNRNQVRGDLKQKSSIFLRMMTDKIVDIARPKTPYKYGNLSRDVVKQVIGLKARIIWNKDYAQVQERGERKDGTYKIRRYSRPGTGPHFAESSVMEGVKNTGIIARRVM